MRVVVVALVAAGTLVTACAAGGGSAGPSEPLELDGTAWRAVQVAGRAPVADAVPTIAFVEGRIEGSGGCNGYGGAARVEGGRLVAPEITQTLILCEGDVGEIEAAFIRVLQSRPELDVVDGRLVLRSGAGEVVLERAT